MTAGRTDAGAGHAGGLLTVMIAVQHNGRDDELGMMTAAADIGAVSPHNPQEPVVALVPREGQARGCLYTTTTGTRKRTCT